MKKYLFVMLLVLPFFLKAQYSTVILSTTTTTQYVYVGSLTASSTNLGNYQKLKVDIFGGGWTSTGLGATTYYIGNRDGLVVNQVTMGSSNDNLFTLQAYTNSTTNATDFYVVTANYYVVFGIKSVGIEYSTPINQYIPITSSTTIPAGTPVAFTINPVMLTDANGNISIACHNSGGYKLAVAGNVHAQQVNVDLSGWSDYVFDKGYRLPTLTETAAYIDKNHHLSEIPSADEITKNGLNLGEMNKLLLKKVEELTLYLIEKDKADKEQQKEIDQLKQQLSTIIKSLNKN